MPMILLVCNVIVTLGILSYAFGEFDPADSEDKDRGWAVPSDREAIIKTDLQPAAGLTHREV